MFVISVKYQPVRWSASKLYGFHKDLIPNNLAHFIFKLDFCVFDIYRDRNTAYPSILRRHWFRLEPIRDRYFRSRQKYDYT